MIGNVLRFKVKRTLVGIAALSLLVPMASHADVTPGRWIFDGFSRSTRDGKGATCVGSGGDTHAFEAPSCAGAASEAKAASEAAAKARKAAQDAAAAKKAAAMREAKEFMPGGQSDFRVRRNDGIKVMDGFGRECVKNGSVVSSTQGDCANPAPQGARSVDSIMAARREMEKEARASKAAAAAAATALPMVPGAALADGQKGAYVYRPAGSNVRDGYGRSCVKDGIWHPARATEECHPDLYNEWSAKTARPEPELLKRVQLPPPEVERAVESVAPPAPMSEPAPAAAAAVSPAPAAPVDEAPAVFPVTKYTIDEVAPEAALPTVAALAAAADMDDGDADDEIVAESDESTDEVDDTPAVFAAETDDGAAEETDALALAAPGDDEDEGDLPADPEEDDDDPMPFLAGDMRDEDDTALALDDDEGLEGDEDALLDEDDAPEAAMMAAGSVDDDSDADDDDVAADDTEDDTETAYLGDDDAPDSSDTPMLAMAAEDDEDEAVFASEDDEDDTETAYLGDDDMPDSSDTPLVAIAAEDDEDEPVFASEDDEDDTETAYLGDDDVADSTDAPMVAMAVEDEDDEPVFASEDDEPDDSPSEVFAEEPAAPAATPSVVVADATPPVTKASPSVSADQKPAEFPITRYEVEGGSAPAPAAKEVETAPAAVTNAECPPTTIQMEEGRFAFDRFTLRPEVVSKLDAIADLLRTAKCDAILITGHTDRIGASKYNQRLSERRAAAAKNYLVAKKGIDPALVSVAGVGENEPVTKLDSCKGKRKKALIACYAPDRRVVITATLRKPAN
jgi:outer membrane protein OmpA-like peptidoglycan-associated protein